MNSIVEELEEVIDKLRATNKNQSNIIVHLSRENAELKKARDAIIDAAHKRITAGLKKRLNTAKNASRARPQEIIMKDWDYE